MELGLVPFTPSKHHIVAILDKIFFDHKQKKIVWRPKKKLKTSTQPKVTTVTERADIPNIDEDLEQMASLNVASAQASAYNVSKLKGFVDEYKE